MKARLIGAALTVVLGLVGALALMSYVRGVEARAQEGERPTEVLVAREPVEEGTPAEDLGERVAVERLPARAVADGNVAAIEDISGKVATSALEPGEQLLASRFASPEELAAQGRVDVPEGLQEVTISLEPQRALGGTLAPGDTVGVFSSLAEGPEEAGGTTHLILHKVLVTSVQGGTAHPSEAEQDTGGESPAGSLLVTVAASARDAERIVFTAEHGTVWLSNQPEDASESGTRIQDRESIYR